MDIENFCDKRPYLYHLTDKDNFPIVIEAGELYSTKYILERAIPKRSIRNKILEEKREEHLEVTFNGKQCKIRDQQPISIVVLDRSLSHGWKSSDFIQHLNKRVFFWPTLDRLERHFVRYEGEAPIIIRVDTKELFKLNTGPLFTNLNSGATRCHPSYKGNAPTRGPNTFLPASEYSLKIPTVAEVTFEDKCILPSELWQSTDPNGNWVKV